MMKFTVFLMVVAACISSSVALQCYDCMSPEDGNCGDANIGVANSSISKKDCGELGGFDQFVSRESIVCMKLVIDKNGTKHVTRSCSKIGSTSNDCTIDGQAPEHCYFCYKDLCNGSSPVGITNMWMTLIPAIVTVALIKYSF